MELPLSASATFEPPAKMQACPKVSNAVYALPMLMVGLLVMRTVFLCSSGIVFTFSLMVEVKSRIQFAYSVARSTLSKM
jgi:hypothetical protein